MVTFNFEKTKKNVVKIVDKTEKSVVNFLKRRYKNFQLENQNKGKIIKATDKDKKTPDWSEQFEDENSLSIKFKEDRTNLKKIKDDYPLLITIVDDQLERIRELEVLSNYHPQFYENWKEQTVPGGVDISLLPHVATFFKGVKTVENKQNVDSSNKIQDDPNNAEKQLDDVIKTISIEVDQLYTGMKKVLNKNIDKSSGEERNSACLKYFKGNLSKFLHIQEKHLLYEPKYWEDENASRGVKGGILKQYISEEHFKLFENKKLRTNYQSLWDRHNDLKKN